MMAAAGILHEEFHSPAFRPFLMVQRLSKAPPSLRSQPARLTE
jgi:hypothetical protein